MTMPHVKFDWTINISVMLGFTIWLLSAIGAWYSLKQEVAVNKAVSDTKFVAVDTSIREVQSSLVTNTTDIRNDIHELRTELVGKN